MTDNKVLKITDDVSWIGVLDPDIRTFDIVMETKFGTTYNSYFINAQKKAVVEVCKEKFWETYLAKLTTLTKPEEIEYIILNHTEPDHSGNVKNLLKLAPKAKIVGSGNVIRFLTDLVNEPFESIEMKHGDVLDLGNKKLQFISATNLHWPDTTYTYLIEDKVLFTCDSFGAHYCNPEMYEDKVGNFDEAFEYYFDVIMKPYAKFMLKAIEKIRPLDIKAICTGHGPLLTHDWKRYVDLSEKYAREALKFPEGERVFIAYVSSYGNTKLMAEAIAQGVSKVPDIEVDVCDIEKFTFHQLDEKLTNATAVIIGSPTINKNTFLPVYTLFAAVSPLRDKGKLAGCFGSYGWSGEVVKILEGNFLGLKFELFPGNLFVKFTPSEEELQRCVEYGETFANKMMDMKCTLTVNS
ncbi:MAG: FprA family A-type flavoprotein [Bacteroidota bacterium]